MNVISSIFNDGFLYLLLAVAGILTWKWLYVNRNELKIKGWIAASLAVLHVIVGVFSVKAFAFLETAGKDYSGGMSLFGAVFFMPVFYYIVSRILKIKARTVFDIFTVPLALTLMLARCNCIKAGCCGGLQIPGTMLHYPTRITELLFYIVFLIIVTPKIYKHETNGEIYPLYMMSYGIFRGINEFFRYSPGASGYFHVAHIWALLSFIIGSGIYFEITNRQRKRKNV